MIQDAGCIVACDYVQVDESTLPVIDNEKHRAVKGYVWSVVNVMTGDRFFFYEHGSRSARVAMGLLKDFTGAIQSDGYIVYEHFEGMEGKKLLGCWAHARRRFFEAKVENEKLALEALSYIRRLYDVEAEADALDAADNKPDHERRKALRQEKAYPEIKKFETWMEASILKCPPKSLMEEAISYTYKILKKLSLYVTDGRYKIDNNMVENSIRPLAIGRKNYLFCGDDDAAQRAAVVPARHTALMNGRGLRMPCAGSRNTNRQGKTTQTFFPETGAPCPQSNSSQYHTPIKRLHRHHTDASCSQTLSTHVLPRMLTT